MKVHGAGSRIDKEILTEELLTIYDDTNTLMYKV